MSDETTNEQTETDEAATATAGRPERHTRKGVVTSTKMNKTIIVREDRLEKHAMYEKYMRRSTKYHVHDEANEAQDGDIVEIMATRPISKLKRWRLVKVVDRPVR